MNYSIAHSTVSGKNEPYNIAIIPLCFRGHDDYPFMTVLAVNSRETIIRVGGGGNRSCIVIITTKPPHVPS
jgi:hypothetical protein